MMRMIRLLLVGTFSLSLLAGAAPTFSEDVAPILFENCTSCHRPGQAGPFALQNYADAKKRGAFLAAVTASGYMPPWHAVSGDVAFADDRRLSEAEIATLAAWVEAGMPEGDPAKTPALPEFAEGWQLGEPNLVAQMDKPFAIPADGPDIYKDFVLNLDVNETQWVNAIEYQPGARTAVHHVLGFLVPADKFNPEHPAANTGDGNRVLTWAVGTNPRILPEDAAVRVDPGMKLVIQVHFHPSGKKTEDLSRVAFHFVDEAPARRVVEVQIPPAFGQLSGIRVPAGTDRYSLRETFELPVDVRAFAVFPHAHYIGKEFKMTAQLPSGETKLIMDVPDYDFAWQEYYYLKEPLVLPAGTKVTSYIRWDNTADNPKNPYSPPQEIKWGLFSEDEMGSIILDVVAVRQEDEEVLMKAQRDRRNLSAAAFYLSTDGEFFKGKRNTPGKRAKGLAMKVLGQFDRDGDGSFSDDERSAAWAYLNAQGVEGGAEIGSDD